MWNKDSIILRWLRYFFLPCFAPAALPHSLPIVSNQMNLGWCLQCSLLIDDHSLSSNSLNQEFMKTIFHSPRLYLLVISSVRRQFMSLHESSAWQYNISTHILVERMHSIHGNYCFHTSHIDQLIPPQHNSWDELKLFRNWAIILGVCGRASGWWRIGVLWREDTNCKGR
jgi:hypothetical protein